MTAPIGAVSFASSAGRRYARAPQLSAIRMACSSSVVTHTLSILGHASAASIDHARSGLPHRTRVFLPGRPFEPALVGTTATTLLFVIVSASPARAPAKQRAQRMSRIL